MSDRPQKWAVEAVGHLATDHYQEPAEMERIIQRAAEPILAVVLAAMSEEGQCCVCTEAVGEDGHGWTEDGFDCPVPAALKAMEPAP